MTASTSPHDSQTGNAALIVTFYGSRVTASEEGLESVTMQLVARLALKAASSPDHWQDLTSDHEVFLQRFGPAASADTTILQLALNEPGAASTAWDALRRRLEAILDESLFNPLWGYSLVYQAEITGIDPSIAELKVGDSLLQAARRPDVPASEATWVQPLARTNLSDGTIWLVDIPQNDGLAAATVYMALNNPDSGNRLVAQHLYGPGAKLLMPDLIAHKGYYQARQYQVGEFREKYSQQLNTMHATTHTQLHQLEEHEKRITKLEDLARDYGYLVDTLSHLEQLRIALARQMHNYGWWQRDSENDEVLKYHRTFLETSLVEIQLLMDEGKGALEAAGTAVEMIQARLDNERQRQQETLNTILAILAVALALPQILDREAVHAILAVMGILVGNNPLGTVWLFGVQAAAILLVMVIAVLLIQLTKKIKKRKV